MLRSAFEKITSAIGVVAGTFFAIAWSVGGIAGAIYWLIEGDAWNVFFSFIIPLYGAVTMILDLTT